MSSLLLFDSNLAGTKFISCLAVVHLMKKMFSMHNKACHKMTNTHRTLIKALLDFNTVTCDHNNSWSLHHAYTSVHKRYKLYTLRIIYLITLFFVRNPLSKTAELFKILHILFFFCAQKENTL